MGNRLTNSEAEVCEVLDKGLGEKRKPIKVHMSTENSLNNKTTS